MTVTRTAAAVLTLLLAVPLTVSCTAPTAPRGQASTAAVTACAPPRGAPKAETPTTIDVIEQAYFCILGDYYSGATLDDRALLTAGFAAFTQELNRDGRDIAEATMPALTGDREADWAAFEAVYRKVTDQVPDLRDTLAVATLDAIVAALGDDHAVWTHGVEQSPDYYDGDGYGLGLQANVNGPQVNLNPGVALPPLFVTQVRGGAARVAGLRPGDVIESINGSAPFVDGAPSPAIAALYPQYPEARPVRLRLLRRSTGRRWTATLVPGLFRQDPTALQVVRSKLLDDDVAYVRITGFVPDSAERILRAIARLREGRTLAGVVLDLRGNENGSLTEAVRLLSAFAHGKVTGYLCAVDDTMDHTVDETVDDTVDDRCETMRTDDTVALINLPLVVLADRSCASACEVFGSAVKDLRLGRLVGTRTAGFVSGPAQTYLLGDNTTLTLPSRRHLGPNREVIDRIGVAPDHYVPTAPEDAAAGHDPALAKALTLLHE